MVKHWNFVVPTSTLVPLTIYIGGLTPADNQQDFTIFVPIVRDSNIFSLIFDFLTPIGPSNAREESSAGGIQQ